MVHMVHEGAPNMVKSPRVCEKENFMRSDAPMCTMCTRRVSRPSLRARQLHLLTLLLLSLLGCSSAGERMSYNASFLACRWGLGSETRTGPEPGCWEPLEAHADVLLTGPWVGDPCDVEAGAQGSFGPDERVLVWTWCQTPVDCPHYRVQMVSFGEECR